MTDEECIALMVLHGDPSYHRDNNRFYFDDVEYGSDFLAIHKLNERRTEWNGFASRGALARAYCEFYKLLPEVTNENVSLQRDGDDQHRSRSCEPG
jgi:hypothetical protein